MSNQYSYGPNTGSANTHPIIPNGTITYPGVVIPNGTITYPGVVSIPANTITPAAGTSTGASWNYTYRPSLPSYVFLKLPISNRIPEMVFVNGKALTIGMFGSNAECAFCIKSLIFGNKMLSENIPMNSDNKLRFILQYKTKIYNYCADFYDLLEPNSRILKTELLSIIKRK